MFMKIHHFRWCLVYKSSNFDQNFLKLGHIVQSHNVFFVYDNGLYRIMPSRVIAHVHQNMSLFCVACENMRISHQPGHSCPTDTFLVFFA